MSPFLVSVYAFLHFFGSLPSISVCLLSLFQRIYASQIEHKDDSKTWLQRILGLAILMRTSCCVELRHEQECIQYVICPFEGCVI